jgi:hypothetical protein
MDSSHCSNGTSTSSVAVEEQNCVSQGWNLMEPEAELDLDEGKISVN